MESFDIAVIGAGAAGMMCAAVAGQQGRRVALIDHAPRLAEKIRISGGGRCNFTNLHAGPANYLSNNPHFCRSALARYTPRDFLALLRQHRVTWHEKHKGQLFCDQSSEAIIDVLRAECDAGRVAWRRPLPVEAVSHADATGFITLSSQNLSLGGALITVPGTSSITSVAAASIALAQLSASITNTNAALGNLGSQSKEISNHNLFVQKLSDQLTTGIGNLVDADLARESARLQALQVQQQLGTQALSIANQAPQIILSLFK